MVLSFFILLSDDLQRFFLSLWLDVHSLVTLDVAVSSDTLRPCWMMLLQSLKSPAMDDWSHCMALLIWLSRRGIRPSRLQMKQVGSWRVRGCDILQLETSDLVYLELKGCCNIRDQCVIDVVNLGDFNLPALYDGNYNVAVGTDCLSQNNSGNNNIAIGRLAGTGVNGNENICIGSETGITPKTPFSRSTCIGY